MFKKTLLAVALVTTSFSSLANWNAGASFIKLSPDVGIDFDFAVVTGSVGYNFTVNEHFSVVPELRLGFGVSEEEIRMSGTDFDLEVETFTSLSVKGQYNFNQQFYGYLAPSYTNIEFKASSGRYSASDDEWDLGFNGGLGVKLNESVAVELSYEDYEDADVIGVGVKVDF